MANNAPRTPEVHAATEIIRWIDDQRKVALHNYKILMDSADLLEQAMARSAPYERQVARKKARKVSNFTRAAAEDCRASAVNFAKMQKAFQAEYQDLLEPKRKNKHHIDWNR